MKAELTVQFLHAISSRLSGRANCNQVEYIVCIGMMNEPDTALHHLEDVDVSNKIFFYPEREVFPDRHHRQQSDLKNIVNYILETQFKDTVWDQEAQSKIACFKEDSLVKGIYKYELSADRKLRHWVRIR